MKPVHLVMSLRALKSPSTDEAVGRMQRNTCVVRFLSFASRERPWSVGMCGGWSPPAASQVDQEGWDVLMTFVRDRNNGMRMFLGF